MDEKPKKASLRGRGRDIMRGVEPDPSSTPESGSGWLPDGASPADDQPYFEDEDALLRWMEADPEADRPTFVPDRALVEGSKKIETGTLYPDPDFDAIFAQAVPPTSKPAPIPITVSDAEEDVDTKERNLEELFTHNDPSFDDLFADVMNDERAPLSGVGRMADLPTMELPALSDMPLPETGDLFADDLFEDRGLVQKAADPDISTVMGNVRMPSGVEAHFDDTPLGDATAILNTNFDDEPLAAHVDQRTLDLLDEMSQPDEPLEDATAILDTRFEDEEPIAPHVDRRTFDLLDEMTGEIEEEGYSDYEAPLPPTPPVEADWLQDEPMQEATRPSSGMTSSEAEAFISMLEQEAGSQPTAPAMSFDDVQPPAPPTPSERAAATQALREPMKVAPIEAATAQTQAAEPFVLTPSSDTQPPLVTEPLFGIEPQVEYHEEATPLGEGETQPINLQAASVYNPAFDEIEPTEPEELAGGQLPSDFYDVEPEYSEAQFDHMMQAAGSDVGGASAEAEATRGLALSGTAELPEPFTAKQPRLTARDLFEKEAITPDKELLAMFVDDNRLRELYEQIEGLQEEIVQNVRGERGNTDTYQDELLLASNLMMQSRENYDEARAIAYRVRADLNRERRVADDIAHYRPLLLNAYIGMAILFVTFAFLGQVFISVAEGAGVPWIGQGFYPSLAGAIGALFFSYLTLHRHTAVDRDFDSSHIYWYLFNPMTGVLSGFLVYLFLYGTAVTTLSGTNPEITGSSPFTLLVAVAAGFYQNSVINILGSAYQRFAPGDEVTGGDPSARR